MILFKRHLRRVTFKCTATFCFRTKSEYYTFLHRQTERYLGPPYNNIFLIVFLLLIYKNSIFTVMRFEETVVQVCSPVLIGSFSCEAEKLACENTRFSSLFAAGDVSRCLLYTSPSPRDLSTSRMPSSA